MDEVKEDVADGTCCSLCGLYFEEAHGSPVVCRSCWEDLTKQQQELCQKATKGEL